MIHKDFAGLDGVYKLYAGDDGGLMGCALRDAQSVTDAGRMSCRVVLSVERFDRSGDLVVLKGIDLSAHRRIPTVLFGHNRHLIVGQAEDPAGNYTVRVDGGRLVGETFFHKHTEFGEQAFRLVETKVLRGASIGFSPDWSLVTKSGKIGVSGKEGRQYDRTELIEYSHIPIPDNNECIVEAVYKGFGGKPLVKPLFDLLSPLVPARPAAVVSGFSSEVIAKAMNNDTLNGAAAPDPMQPQPQQDPNQQQPQQDPNVVDHHAAVKDGIGTIMASVFEEFDADRIDMKGFLSQMQKLAETHRHAKALGTGDAPESGDKDTEDADGPDVDDVTDDDPEPDDLADEDPEDFEPDPERPGKKKHVLTWTEKSVDASVGLWDFLTADVTRVADVAAPFAAVLKTAHAALSEGKAVNPDKLAVWITKAAARSARAVDKLTGRRDAVLARAEADFGPVRKAIRTGLIKKAAPRPAEEIDDETADRIAAALLQTRTELYEATGK